MSDDANDIIANEVREDAAGMPRGDSPAEDGEVRCGPATTSDEPVPADHTGEQHETTAACAETAPTGLLKQAKISDAKEAPLNGEVTEDMLAECIDSVSLEGDTGSDIPLKEQNDVNHDSHQLLDMACIPGALLASWRAVQFTPCNGSKLRMTPVHRHGTGQEVEDELFG
ncbi:Protein Noxp20 [Microtus ochrogaster]|uniref:Protein Noxp20 n=1 Tax=Microtus ochrogaster TaxID=79684 RepID=A0A8J6GGL5_MICOH|nr:Protein Noxp20 [Microtus ochrogaster]